MLIVVRLRVGAGRHVTVTSAVAIQGDVTMSAATAAAMADSAELSIDVAVRIASAFVVERFGAPDVSMSIA